MLCEQALHEKCHGVSLARPANACTPTPVLAAAAPPGRSQEVCGSLHTVHI